MPKRTVARISKVVLKWLIPALWCRLIAVGTGAILDLVSRGGYRAKEMPPLCSHFAFERQTETPGKKCPGVFNAYLSGSAAVINNFALTVAGAARASRFEFHSAINGVGR
jgi:hypothetical protein